MRSAGILSGRAFAILAFFGVVAWQAGLTDPAQAQVLRRSLCFPWGTAPTPYVPETGVGGPEETAESAAGGGGGATVSDLAALDTAPTSPTSLAPNMLGDSCWCGGSGMMLIGSEGSIPVSGGMAVGRFKVAENTSPLPQDRVFFNYSHFENVYTISTWFPQEFTRDVNVDRFTLGGEKTFHDGASSVELRIPFAGTLRHDLDVARLDDAEAVEFGDITLNFKRALYRGDCAVVAAGLGVTFPTGPASQMALGFGDLEIDDEAVHLLPYLGLLLTPTERLFTQFFAQFDFDAGGNSVVYDGENVGKIQEQSLLFLDWSVGYWLYRRCCPDCCGPAHEGLVGLAPMFELHYTTMISDADSLSLLGGELTNPSGRNDFLNLTGGLECQFGDNWFVRVAAVAPLKDRPDRRFDAEVLLQVNRMF
jgi:hypothetical protein